MFQARCQETLFVTDWGVPLVIALLLLGVIYLFIYLPASLQQSSADEVVRNMTDRHSYSGVGFVKQNVEELCRFPSLPVRKPLTYQAKQLIAREIELEKMRRSEATLQTRNSAQTPEPCLLPDGKGEGAGTDPAKSSKRNHEQRLDHIVKGATFDEKPETDFFGRLIVKKTVSPAAADQAPVKNSIEKQIGKAVGQSDVWFRFNEGVSNAVRRNIYIKDLF